VVYHPSDLEWAEQHAKKANTTCKLYLQPEWSKKEKITPLLLDYIKQHPQWELSLQVHKYLDIF
jgi:organic radical activating enzyme